MSTVELPTYKPKDFATDQDIRWCPGCGDYAALKAVQMTLSKVGTRREDFVFISGIGCAARFPYYVNTYGMHSIHGRALAFATGAKIANPALDLWVVSGDGDLLSIGGNHTSHAMRRNVDVNIVLLNNKIYGLTKGQCSPTSEYGKKTKSTPHGSVDYPLNPLSIAVGAGCTFIARSIDVDVKHCDAIMMEAAAHKGASFIEIYQDCNIFNHKAWFYASQKDARAENTFLVKHGEPMIFGADNDKGLRMNGHRIEAVSLGNGVSESDLLVHDETDSGLAFLLSQLRHPEFPEPLGILHRNPNRQAYGSLVHDQIKDAVEARGEGDIKSLITEGETWEVT